MPRCAGTPAQIAPERAPRSAGLRTQIVRVVDLDEIRWYNVMMRSMSHEMAFATTYEALEGTPLPP